MPLNTSLYSDNKYSLVIGKQCLFPFRITALQWANVSLVRAQRCFWLVKKQNNIHLPPKKAAAYFLGTIRPGPVLSKWKSVLFDLITHFFYSVHFISFNLAPYWQDLEEYGIVTYKRYTNKKSLNLIQYSMSTSGETSAVSLSIK